MKKITRLFSLPRCKLPLNIIYILVILGAIHVALTGIHVESCDPRGCVTVALTLVLLLISPATIPMDVIVRYIVIPYQPILMGLFIFFDIVFYALLGYIYERIKKALKNKKNKVG